MCVGGDDGAVRDDHALFDEALADELRDVELGRAFVYGVADAPERLQNDVAKRVSGGEVRLELLAIPALRCVLQQVGG